MKNIIIGCDGTWIDSVSSNNISNIYRIAQLAKQRDDSGAVQVTYYDSGIGTNGKFDELFGGYTGAGLDKNIREAYDFLVNNYEPGDKVFLFGFSRGAYTVRSLAGLIYNVGLLKKEHADKIHEGFELYRSRLDSDKPSSTHARDFRDKYSQKIDIAFLGVFETVGALGIPYHYNQDPRYLFHDTTLNTRIKVARQAMAIDEKRYDFMPTLLGENGHTDIQERAFPGVHADVGGGYEDSKGLADIALHWMVAEAESQGLSVDWSVYPECAPDPKATLHDSYQGALTKLAGFEQRHLCDIQEGHLFKSNHSFWKKSNYPTVEGKQARCPHTHLSIDQSFFQRKQKVPGYDPDNVELKEKSPLVSDARVSFQ